MTEKEFDLLYAVHKNNSISNFDMETISHCQDAGLLKDGKVTDKGYEALKPYKVDNAIIMAAGRSRRCMPLSNYLPKGLFEIKGVTKSVHSVCSSNVCNPRSIRQKTPQNCKIKKLYKK